MFPPRRFWHPAKNAQNNTFKGLVPVSHVREWLRGIANEMTVVPGTVVVAIIMLTEWEDTVIRPGPAISNLGDEVSIILRKGDPVLSLEGLDRGAGRRGTQLVLMPVRAEELSLGVPSIEFIQKAYDVPSIKSSEHRIPSSESGHRLNCVPECSP